MRILIAGGAGYIGSALTPKLLERGYQVEVLDLLWFGSYLPEEVPVIQKDIFDLTEEELRPYDQVIYLAGLSNDPMAEYSPRDNFIHNAASSAYLGYIAKNAGVKRMIYASSCSVYGFAVDQFYDEEAPAKSDYPYGISKLQGERSVMQLADEDFSVICLRQGTVSGHSPRMRFDLVINTMFKAALQNGEIVVNNPSIWRPIFSIKDAISAYTRSVEAVETVSGVFNVASGNYTIGELGDIVKEKVESLMDKKIKLTINHKHDLRNYKVTLDKANAHLSFKPRYTVESIVQDLHDNLHLYEDLDDPSYYNIQVFKKLKEQKGEKA